MTSVGPAHRLDHFAEHQHRAGHAADMSAYNSPVRLAPRPSSPAPSELNETRRASTNTASSGRKRSIDVANVESDKEPDDHPMHDSANSSERNNSASALAATQQPKVIQTAFIHKLYSMLEDQSIKHLIAWSHSADSFIMSPSTEFSKVLASYFKHTNISSFVRQLNMYGFHKVSDVFHTGAPDSPLWEFKHGGGNFRKGDLAGLKDIKRRASRHTLMHRESFSGPVGTRAMYPAGHPAVQVSNAPIIVAAPVMQAPMPAANASYANELVRGPTERLGVIESSVHDILARLKRAENMNLRMHADLAQSHQWSNDLAEQVLRLSDPGSIVYKDASAIHAEIGKHIAALRSFDTNASAHHDTAWHRQSLSHSATSPRLFATDPSRRPSLQVTGPPRVLAPPTLPPVNTSPQRGGLHPPDENVSPISSRIQGSHMLPALTPHKLGTVGSATAMDMGRRHTAADIYQHEWPGRRSPKHAASSYRALPITSDQQLRDSLAQYELPTAKSRQTSPPVDNSAHNGTNKHEEAGWQGPDSRLSFSQVDYSGSGSRRTSMAVNVNSLLNPTSGAKRDGEEIEDRKRQRYE